MSEIGACFSEPPLRLEGSVHGQSEASTKRRRSWRLRHGHPVLPVGRGGRRGAAAWPNCPGQQEKAAVAAALCSPKLGHHHRRSHDGSYSLPLGWPIGFLASFRGLLVCINFQMSPMIWLLGTRSRSFQRLKCKKYVRYVILSQQVDAYISF